MEQAALVPCRVDDINDDPEAMRQRLEDDGLIVFFISTLSIRSEY